MEQKGIDAISQFIGSEYAVVTVASVLNHFLFFYAWVNQYVA